MKRSLAILIWLCLLPLVTYHEAAGAENSCVECHRNLPRNTMIGAKYLDWKNSIHAKENVTCDRCHGGNPSAQQKEAAHTVIYNSSNPKSRVYYKRVPEMCGGCHRYDFNAFKRSTHYTFLEQKGAGPTCVTCHESHATRLITPLEIPLTCEECHNRRTGINPEIPKQAQVLLLLINETSLLVRCTKERVQEGQQKKSKTWEETSTALRRVRDEWHAFNLNQVQIQILEVYDWLKVFLKKKK
jgi:hypothetical protein